MKYLVDPLQEVLSLSDELDEAIAKWDSVFKTSSNPVPEYADILKVFRDLLIQERWSLASRVRTLQS